MTMFNEKRGRTRRQTVAVRVGAPLLAFAAVTVGAATVSGQALAGGKSSTVEGCYAQWWNTAFAGYCVNTPVTVHVALHADCGNELDYTGKTYTIHGTVTPFDNSECSWNVNSASLIFH